MKHLALLALWLGTMTVASGQDLMPTRIAPPDRDARLAPPRDLNTVVPPPTYGSRAAWQHRRADLREQILCAAGLSPMPPRPAIAAHVSGRLEREGYSVEKVWFETRPGLVLGGNLYRPLDGVQGRRPAILTPHGHAARGRLAHDELFDAPGRCINLARAGFVVFTYDMVDYNDTGMGLGHRSFGIGSPVPALYSISMFGLQTWNSIRALDFLAALPDVDAQHIGVTGESGGGTQTFVLCAIDDRPAAAAPVNMVSLHMQGGCLCENAPGLRLDTNNVEIAALFAPKPLLLVAATGDWTKDTPRLEGPGVRAAYALYGAEDKVDWVQYTAPHNYNKSSRQAVYAWFAHWLQGKPRVREIAEQPFTVDSDADLRVFSAKPAEQSTEAELTRSLTAERQPDLSQPARLEPALRHSLGIEPVAPSAVVVGGTGDAPILGRADRGDRVQTTWRPGHTGVVLLGDDPALAAALAAAGRGVMTVKPFAFDSPRDRVKEFYTGYNRTDLACRVQDALTAVAALRARGLERVELVGSGRAGLTALLAAAWAGADAVVCDVDDLDTADDTAYTTDLWQPGLRLAGDLRTAALLAAAHGRVTLHNSARFQPGVARPPYALVPQRLDADSIVARLNAVR
ncbi:MAG: acetylxylan esterase [Armatimonadetes bacterium]|nr:acetylxylan esterase [Armatimonadota bacterium]